MKKELWIFTVNYPTGAMEDFVGNSLPELCRQFKRVRVFPLFEEPGIRSMPEGAELCRVIRAPYAAASPSTVFRYWGICRAVLRTVRKSAPTPGQYKLQRRVVWSKLRQGLDRMRQLREAVGQEYDPARVVLYSSWTDDWATVLGLWRMADPRVKFSSRMNGYDMFHYRADEGWLLFQAFHMQQASHLYIASRAGAAYIADRYPQHQNKISVSYTATFDHGPGPWSPSDVFRIVSCSNLVPLKRVHLIAEALCQADFPVHWTHFGDGPERRHIEGILSKLPTHVHVELRGAVSNAELIAHYKHHPVDLFVHPSASEGGVAVALQEAASFGIPLLAADAGGVSEMVNEHTGRLLPLDLEAGAWLQSIAWFKQHGHDVAMRDGVREFWRSHFESTRVHRGFAQGLDQGWG